MSAIDMYREYLLDLYKSPHNFGDLDKFTHQGHQINNVCGDSLFMKLEVEDNIIKNVKFKGNGCVISMASASLLTDAVKGKTLEDARNISVQNVLDMLEVEVNPARLKCAVLSLGTLSNAIK